MNYKEFENRIKSIHSIPLPGSEAQHKLAPIGREKLDIHTIDISKAKRAAVAAIFFEKNQTPHLILTLRNKYPGVHSGQISFPGGKEEKIDVDAKDTALRETWEEIGIRKDEITIHREISPIYIPPSNFYVRPFIGSLVGKPSYIREEKEVNKILSLDFNHFLNDDNLVLQKIQTAKKQHIEIPTFLIEGYTIWGATAMMISELKELFLTE